MSAIERPLCLLFVLAGCGETPPHEPPRSDFLLVGVHAAIPCEACHGEGPYERLPESCDACHEQDRPADHYQGGCGAAGCHTPVGWQNGGITTGDDDDDDTTLITGDDDDDTTTTTTTTTGTLDHSFLPLEGPHNTGCSLCHTDFPDTTTPVLDSCQQCHDGARPNPYHYTGEDCAHCHPVEVAWAGSTDHPFKLPHPPGGNVNNCASCHPNAADRSASFDCLACHPDPETESRHGGLPGYSHVSTDCLACHPKGSQP